VRGESRCRVGARRANGAQLEGDSQRGKSIPGLEYAVVTSPLPLCSAFFSYCLHFSYSYPKPSPYGFSTSLDAFLSTTGLPPALDVSFPFFFFISSYSFRDVAPQLSRTKRNFSETRSGARSPARACRSSRMYARDAFQPCSRSSILYSFFSLFPLPLSPTTPPPIQLRTTIILLKWHTEPVTLGAPRDARSSEAQYPSRVSRRCGR